MRLVALVCGTGWREILDIDGSDTVADIREVMGHKGAVADPSAWAVLHNAALLEDGARVDECGVVDNGVVVLVPAATGTAHGKGPATPVDAVVDASLAGLVSMGFDADAATVALRVAEGDVDEALAVLLSGVPVEDLRAAVLGGASDSEARAAARATSSLEAHPAWQEVRSRSLAHARPHTRGPQLRDLARDSPERLPALLDRLVREHPGYMRSILSDPAGFADAVTATSTPSHREGS